MDILGSANTKTANIYKEQALTSSLESTLKNPNSRDEELKKACMEFESYFTNLLFKEMRSTINKDDSFIKENKGEQVFTEMLDEEVSKSIANSSNGMGLAQSLYEQMKSSSNSITYEQYLSQQEASKKAVIEE